MFLDEIRRPQYINLKRKIIYSSLILLSGVVLGIISKMLDETEINLLPYVLQKLDLGNFFSRIGIWIFLAVTISINSKTAFRAAINVFLFFTGMLSSYYLVTILVAGFYPDKTYLIIWICITILSPLMAFVCWYAKGSGIVPIIISSIIFMVIARQAFIIGFWYFDILNILEAFLCVGIVIMLYQSPKQIVKVLFFGTTLLVFIYTFLK